MSRVCLFLYSLIRTRSAAKNYSYTGHLFYFKGAFSYCLAIVFPLTMKFLQLYIVNRYSNSEILVAFFPPQELQPSKGRPAAAPAIPSLTSSPWAVLPSQWPHPWPSPATQCIMEAKAPPCFPSPLHVQPPKLTTA